MSTQSTSYRWGIMACGHIASRFAEGMLSLQYPYLKAVASRSQEKAQTFADRFSIPVAYGSYEELAKDPHIDIVYIASPHQAHHENTLLCLEHGKHVLCEKPLAVNAKQGREMAELARKNKLLLMEGIWTRFLPVMVQLRKWLEEDLIGDIRMIRAGFNFRPARYDAESRLFNPKLAGGALLDVGIYPIMLSYMVFGKSPSSIQSLVHRAPTGVDYQSAILFGYENGAIASLTAGLEGSGSMDAMIIGTKGEIRIPIFWKGSKALISYPQQEVEEYLFPFESSGLQYQAVHFMECLDNKLLQSPVMSNKESLAILESMDLIREQWGLKYPFE